MNRDPFYTQIVEKLNGTLDADIFEDCASDLLRSIYPGLTPIRGGSDSGMDGAIGDNAGEPFPLVTTTSDDVISNLTRNLTTYKKDGGTRRVAVLACSCSLTPRRKNNLFARARELDFELQNIHDQSAFANLLYNNPHWCLELLNLPSTPPPLSKIPKTERPFLNAPLVGRGTSLDWLYQTRGDRLLLGQPGSGKTFLLHKLAEDNRGLFLISRTREEIASGIRSQLPTAIFVDDAARDRDLIITLRHMRQEMNIDFDIIATGWLGEKNELIQSLNLPDSRVHHLDHLTRDEIVEVVHGAGIKGSERLIKEIVDQAEGRPGLAVTLTLLCLQGGIRDVVIGDFLSSFVLDFAGRFIDERSTYILAVLSLTGNQGATLSALEQILKIPITDLHRTIKKLAASGVVMEITGGQITVRPPALRYALVRNVFFTGTGLPIEPILKQLPNRLEAIFTLIGTRGRGANISDDLLRSLVSELDMPNGWEAYAWLGHNEAEWAFYQCSGFLKPIAAPGLANAPELYLPALLTSCIGDDRPLHANPDHVLRLIEDWVKSADPGTIDSLEHRQILLTILEKWLSSGGDWNVGGKALQLVMSPQFENHSSDPGSGRRFSIKNGIVSSDNIEKIKALWPRVLRVICSIVIENWSSIHGLIEEWAYPGRFGVSLPENVYSNIRSFANQMLVDVISQTTQHPGTLHWANELAKNCDFEVQVNLDTDFETLYPPFFHDDDLKESQEHWLKSLKVMTDQWSLEKPEVVAQSLAHIEDEARKVNISWPRLSTNLSSNLADLAVECLPWAKAFLAKNLPSDLLYPFLKRAMDTNETGWQEFFIDNLSHPALQDSIVSLILTSNGPPNKLLLQVLKMLDKRHFQWIRLVCSQNAVPEQHLRLLFNHVDSTVAQAAAEGEWLAEPKGVIRSSLIQDWEKVIVRSSVETSSDHGFWLGEIFSKSPDLSLLWLRRLISQRGDKYSSFLYRNVLRAAISSLSHGSRLELLEQVPDEYGFDKLVIHLVEKSPERYQCLLDISRLKRYHLVPLSGDLSDEWFKLATLATQAGFGARDIAIATMEDDADILHNMDGEADKWANWIKRFEKISSNDDAIIKMIAETGTEIATKRLKSAQDRLRNESVYGYFSD